MHTKEMTSISAKKLKKIRKMSKFARPLASDAVSYTKSLEDFKNGIDRGVYTLDPPHQRDDIYSDKWKSGVLVSLWNTGFIPPPEFHLRGGNVYESLDGKQRCLALYQYVSNNYAIKHSDAPDWLKNKTFEQLDEEEKSQILRVELNIQVYKREYTPEEVTKIFRDRQMTEKTTLGELINSNPQTEGFMTVYLRDIAHNQMIDEGFQGIWGNKDTRKDKLARISEAAFTWSKHYVKNGLAKPYEKLHEWQAKTPVTSFPESVVFPIVLERMWKMLPRIAFDGAKRTSKDVHKPLLHALFEIATDDGDVTDITADDPRLEDLKDRLDYAEEVLVEKSNGIGCPQEKIRFPDVDLRTGAEKGKKMTHQYLSVPRYEYLLDYIG